MSETQVDNQHSELSSAVVPVATDPVMGADISPDATSPLAATSTGLVEYTGLVTFRLGRQIFALPIEPIVQIVEMVTITPLPQAIESLEGVINVRGSAVPVINLRRHFGLGPLEAPVDPHIILVQYAERVVGLIVDQVLTVLDSTEGRMTHTVDMIPRELGELPLLQGLLFGQDETVLLLDLAHLFLPQHQLAMAQAVVAGEEEE